MSNIADTNEQSTCFCSFCKRSQHDVRTIVAGPDVFICDECVEICMTLVRGDSASFYLRSPDEYRRLGEQSVRQAEAAGIPPERALYVGQTWFRLADEAAQRSR